MGIPRLARIADRRRQAYGLMSDIGATTSRQTDAQPRADAFAYVEAWPSLSGVSDRNCLRDSGLFEFGSTENSILQDQRSIVRTDHACRRSARFQRHPNFARIRLPSETKLRLDRNVTAAMGAALLFGLSTPLAKELVGDVPPLLLAGLLYVGSGAGLLVLLGIRISIGRGAGIRLPRAPR